MSQQVIIGFQVMTRSSRCKNSAALPELGREGAEAYDALCPHTIPGPCLQQYLALLGSLSFVDPCGVCVCTHMCVLLPRTEGF